MEPHILEPHTAASKLVHGSGSHTCASGSDVIYQHAQLPDACMQTPNNLRQTHARKAKPTCVCCSLPRLHAASHVRMQSPNSNTHSQSEAHLRRRWPLRTPSASAACLPPPPPKASTSQPRPVGTLCVPRRRRRRRATPQIARPPLQPRASQETARRWGQRHPVHVMCDVWCVVIGAIRSTPHAALHVRHTCAVRFRILIHSCVHCCMHGIPCTAPLQIQQCAAADMMPCSGFVRTSAMCPCV
mmetsp:Transcript_21232/g.63596  ORF Transcript_21232/g.63596 Transcript_21232/m.63596 type:complete len:243 (+) Transcript_21232:535-1263(+)